MAKLRSIATKIGSGATPRGGKGAYKKTGISLVRSLNVYDFRFDYDELAFIDDQQGKALSNVEVHPNDILLNITGASVARCCMVPSHVLPARVNQDVAIVRSNTEVADPSYVLYCINSPQYKHHLLTLAQGGATRAALTKDTIGNFEIPLPPLATQHKIASVLSAYDALIENNTRRIEILEEMAHSIYREWFVNFRFPGYEKVRMVDSELGPIPEGWEAKTLGEVCRYINRGISPKYDDESQNIVVNQRCIRNGRLNLNLARRHSKKVPPEKLIRFGDGLINSTGVGTLGRVTQVYSEVEKTTVDSHVSIVRPSDQLTVDYFGLALLKLQTQFEYMGQGATGQTELNRQRIANTRLLLPDTYIQEAFSEIVASMRRNAVLLHIKNANLRRTRDLLLPKLISGEVNVEDLEISTVGFSEAI